LCCLAGGHNYGDVRKDKALHLRLDFQEIIELING
jgi:hypothetical protein